MTSNQKSPQAQVSDLATQLSVVEIGGTAAPVAEELEQFRKEWKKEVASKRPHVAAGGAAPRKDESGSIGSNTVKPGIAGTSRTIAKEPPKVHVEESIAELDEVHASRETLPRKPRAAAKKEDALSLYARAVESEQSGKLNEALILYRRAFKLDDNVDRQYARSSLHKENINAINAPPTIQDGSYSFQRHIQTAPDYERRAGPSSRASPLTSILQKVSTPLEEITFVPFEENLPVHLALLPGELVDAILAHLGVADIERFGSTCWRARCLTAQSPIWRRIAEGIYRNPSMLSDRKVGDLVSRHRGEWRTTLLEEERVRMDGCYISVCHYIRPGAGEQWITVTHMITYHRFLRFYPDGKVISFLTTDHPSEVVPLLRPSLRGKGLHFGTWRLVRADQIDPAHSESFLGKGEKPRAKILISDLAEPGIDQHKYEFEMELGLRETGRGKWNKLDIQRYSSINLSTGETLALSLKHQKPFYFSKVLSYHPQL